MTMREKQILARAVVPWLQRPVDKNKLSLKNQTLPRLRRVIPLLQTKKITSGTQGRAVGIQKENWGVTTHFLEIIKQQLFKKAVKYKAMYGVLFPN